ncbi:unnamed protein product [Ostreobium quekettii]|uniref:DNA damage-inducible protein 1 n=1 Tax=Ostreobium quekettii TaxID=121088 RepID=A0A8S1IMS4_9CHLO|nr:unnamed protein product [Ostreobium quekettii]|eukprot:evm.model.scf_237.1 EVM.evm.TU.scf_237.1   scf_237:6966-11522(+)
MKLTITTADGNLVNVDVDEGEIVGSLKAILEVETGVPMAQQILSFNGSPLSDDANLASTGVKDGELLMLMRAGGAPTPGAGSMAAPGIPADLVQAVDQLRNDPARMRGLEQNNPELARAVRSGDYGFLMEHAGRAKRREAELEREYARLEADPFDVDAQKRIEEIIREKNVEDNFSQAMEHNPEVFGTVTMVYVNMEVNGVEVPALVDSGAQTTIMTVSFAEKCNLLRLVDKRYAGVAFGAGSSKILGRVHQAPIKVGSNYLASSITIMEQRNGPQFIFGLDNLYRHECSIKLKEKVLYFGSADCSMDFLAEHEVPKHVYPQDIGNTGESSNPGPPQGSALAQDQSESKQPSPSASAPASVPTAGGDAPQPTAGGDAPQPTAGGGPTEESILKLMSLGFDRARCIWALNAAGGNTEAAASLLFSEMDI